MKPQNSGVTHPNLIDALCRLPRRTRTNSRVGRWRRSGKNFPGKIIFEGWGVQEESKNLKKLFLK